MKIKKSIVLISAASIALFSAVAVLFSSRGQTAKLSADGDTNDYRIEFTKADFSGEFEEPSEEPEGDSQSYYLFALSKEKEILDTYDISSEDRAFAYADNESKFDFTNPNCIFEISNSDEWGVGVSFSLINRANLIDDQTYLNVEINGEPMEIGKSSVNDSFDFKSKVYDFSVTYNEYGPAVSFKLISVVLSFSCAKQ